MGLTCGTFSAVMLLAVFAVYLGSLFRAPPRRLLGHEANALGQQLAEGFGMELSHQTGNVFVFTGEVAGHPATLRLSQLGYALTVSVPLPDVVVFYAGEETPNRRKSAVRQEERELGLSPPPSVEGDAMVAQAILGPSMRALDAAAVWCPGWARWGAALVVGGVWYWGAVVSLGPTLAIQRLVDGARGRVLGADEGVGRGTRSEVFSDD